MEFELMVGSIVFALVGMSTELQRLSTVLVVVSTVLVVVSSVLLRESIVLVASMCSKEAQLEALW